MVDQANLIKVTQLNDERNRIMRAQDMLHEEGARITNMIVGEPLRNEEGEAIGGWLFSELINTEYMDYPQQMLDAISNFLGNRIMEITNELDSMGLTGIEEPKPRGPEPTNAKPKSKKRRAA